MPSVTPRYKKESFDRMLRRFKNQCEKAGIVKRVREKQYYEKPNSIKHRKNQEQKRTLENNARKALALEMRRRQSRMR